MKRFMFWRKGPNASSAASEEHAFEASRLLTGDPVQDAQSLEILLESIAEVNSSVDLDRVLEDIVDKALDVTRAERGILLLGSGVEDLRVRVARDKDGRDLGTKLTYSQTLVNRCLVDGHAERSIVQSDQEALELGQSVYNLKLRAVMCAPLRARERPIGVIYVDSTAVRREFSGRDLALFGALSVQLATAVETARLHADSLEKARLQKDFEIARQIQLHLIPPVPNDVAGLELGVRFYARDEASGDTYDLMPLPDGRLVALIGDATGHGVGAALLSHAVQAAVRSYLELIDDLSEVARRLNDRLVHSVETGNFMSLLMVLIDPRAMTMQYVNGGHPSLILVRDGVAQEFDPTGMVFGVVAGRPDPAAGPIALLPGDLLFARSDGVDETMNERREMFGPERLHEVLSRCPPEDSPDDVLRSVEAATAAFADGSHQDDDLTMLAVRVRGRQ